MRDYADPFCVAYFFFFGSSNRLQPRRAHRFSPQNELVPKDAVPCNDVPFEDGETSIYNFSPLLLPQTPKFGRPIFDLGLRFFSTENNFNIGRLKSKRPLTVVVAP